MAPTTSTLAQGLATAMLAALPFAQAQGTTPPKLTAACNDVAIFMARGNDAPYHDGRTSPFLDTTCDKFTAQGNTCDYLDIVFDASLGVDLCPSIQGGALNGVRQITEYNAKCPDTLIVINGYSQGAMVAGSVLSGGGDGNTIGEACFPSSVTTGLDPASAAGQAVKAALLWGDIKHTPNQSYNVLSGADKGKSPRVGANLERLNAYAGVLRAYCDAADPVCAGGDVIAKHLDYFDLYTDAASSWVVEKLTPFLTKNASSPSSSAVSTPVSTPKPQVSSVVVPVNSTEVLETASSVQTQILEVSTQPLIQTSTATIVVSTSSRSYGNTTVPVTTVVPVQHGMQSSLIDSVVHETVTTKIPQQPLNQTSTATIVVSTSSKYYGNATVPATSTVVPVQYGTPSSLVTSVVLETITTKIPQQSAGCPAEVYETVTEQVTRYV